MNLFIDTNIFLDFYHFSSEDLDSLSNLKKLIETNKIILYLPRQVIDEFNRNRDKKVNDSLKKYEYQKLEISFPKLCEGYEEKDKILKAVDEVKTNKKILIGKIKEDFRKKGLKADQLIEGLFSSNSVKIIEIKEEIIEKVKKRAIRGNPPGKLNSYGDAINWEILLEKIPWMEDLYLVSSDKDYSDCVDQTKISSFLDEEWEKRKSSKILLYKSLNDFFKNHFPEVEITGEEIKNAKIEKFANSKIFDDARVNLSDLKEIGEFSDLQISKIIEASISNFQIYGAHQYSPDEIGQVLAKIVENHEEALNEDTYLEFCNRYNVEL